MLKLIHAEEVTHALEALYYNAYMTMPPAGVDNVALINQMVADKEKGYSIQDIIRYIFPKD